MLFVVFKHTGFFKKMKVFLLHLKMKYKKNPLIESR